MVQEVVIKLLIQLHIQKLKVIHVVRYLEELILRIKQRARRLQVFLVSASCLSSLSPCVKQRRINGRGRTIHRGVTGTAMAICTTTQNHPPQHPVPPPDPVSVYLHRNVLKPMEMNQTMQLVHAVHQDAHQIPVYYVIAIHQRAQGTSLPLIVVVLLVLPENFVKHTLHVVNVPNVYLDTTPAIAVKNVHHQQLQLESILHS